MRTGWHSREGEAQVSKDLCRGYSGSLNGGEQVESDTDSGFSVSEPDSLPVVGETFVIARAYPPLDWESNSGQEGHEILVLLRRQLRAEAGFSPAATDYADCPHTWLSTAVKRRPPSIRHAPMGKLLSG